MAARKGNRQALVAVMHKLTVAIRHILHDRVEHHDLGAEYCTRRDPPRAMQRMPREANAPGLTARFGPSAATVPAPTTS